MISVAVLSGGAGIAFVDDVPALNRFEHLRSEVLLFHGSQTILFLIIQGTEEAAGKSEGSDGMIFEIIRISESGCRGGSAMC
jgi:hypothetical protein